VRVLVDPKSLSVPRRHRARLRAARRLNDGLQVPQPAREGPLRLRGPSCQV
jgi:hypothetical protein